MISFDIQAVKNSSVQDEFNKVKKTHKTKLLNYVIVIPDSRKYFLIYSM